MYKHKHGSVVTTEYFPLLFLYLVVIIYSKYYSKWRTIGAEYREITTGKNFKITNKFDKSQMNVQCKYISEWV